MLPPLIHEQFVANETTVTMRTILPSDAGMEQGFMARLSLRSRHYRFLSGLKALTPDMLTRFINVNYPAEMALIATVQTAAGEQEIAVARYAQWSTPGAVEFAIVVADEWQRRGIGRRLLERLFAIARADGHEAIEGLVLRENTGMLGLITKLGFTRHRSEDDASVVRVRLELQPQTH